ncbi:DNA excision repair protein ERCC-6-like [Amyelois transitella]|uniref:DNA excision repair protein ERCC-6-like n=1 Tax=Amyelois transitella TaxID=680683 RepID=UPI00067B4943|nr:DNA excision repair protein ERCC-6-like [Amyelois transitella]
MVDINKYLESQLALAKERSAIKSTKKQAIGCEEVSQRSKSAADKISKKQDRQFNKNLPSGEASTGTSRKPSTPHADSDDDEYLPSDDECDGDLNINCSIPSTSRGKQNLKKIIDDGDQHLYDERIKVWKGNLSAVSTGQSNGVITSADIQYLVSGNKDFDKFHELQNGFNVPNYIWKQLYKYQRIGVKWLWELHQVQSGGLLGDEMGLGKTIQIIGFLAGLYHTDSGNWGGLGPSIIVAPATIIYQWVSQFHYWCPNLRVAVLHHSGSHVGNHNKLIKDLHASHGILLVTYAGIVKYSQDLLSKKWHYIILDEGHKIRNPEAQVTKFIKKFQTPHKLLVTGSPMQNSLQELWSLFDFMRPGLLGTYAAFMEHFALPITQGGYANATQLQEATAFEIAKALKNLITPYMLRRTKSEVQDHIKLPEKNEQVLFCALSQEQRDLYMGYLTGSTVRSILDKDNKFCKPVRARILVALSTLRKICNHPDLYLYEAQDEMEHIDEQKFGHWKRSGKMTVVNSLLKIWQKQGHRALIFSQSRAMLCILEQYLQNQEFKYLKMDGTVSVSQRQNLIKTFNDNSEYMVFLATTRVGGLGVNLTGADRVIIYDPDWNPATDNQAKERAWRIGQQRNVTVYRLLSAGTIEEKIYQRQIFKHFLSNKILVDPNQKNVLTTSTLHGLFHLEDPNHEGDTETASLFKHTKVNVNNKSKTNKDDIHMSGGVSFSKKKLEAMRRQAKEISKKIAHNVEKPQQLEEDPRERYKKKRELLLNPPKEDEPEINLVDDKVTNVPFENVLSELDIINLHTKKDYEENLIKQVLKQDQNDDILDEGELTEDLNSNLKETKESSLSIEECESNIDTGNETELNEATRSTSQLVDNEQVDNEQDDYKKKKNKKSNKRKYSSDLDSDIESLLAVKKVKRKKHKKEKHENKGNDDDYVLSKLFAKANVKNALQHDIVVGLAEKEKMHRMKEEASKKAKFAVRAIKFSS